MDKRGRLWLFVATAVVLIGIIGCAPGEREVSGTPTFVGSNECRTCHAREYQGWLETLHSQGIQDPEANPKAVMGDFDVESDVRTFSLNDVAYIFGVQWKQRYLTETTDSAEQGDFLILPAQYNLATNQWKPYEAEAWQTRPFTQKCSGCHATGVTNDRLLGIEMNVGCEACHGPGSNHVEGEGRERPRSIVNPAKLPSDIGAMVCGRCHSRGSDRESNLPFAVNYIPGEYLFNTFTLLETTDTEHFFPDGLSKAHHLHYIDWRQSAHALHGVTCMSCHTVHSTGVNNKLQTKLPGSTLCRSCHEMNQPTRIHAIHSFGSCIECHMVRTAKSAVEGDIHIHTFKTVSPAETVADPNVRNSCSCHPASAQEMRAIYEQTVGAAGSSATRELTPPQTGGS